MNKYFRYIIYLLIGVLIYYVSGADKDPEALSGLRKNGPAIIIVVFAMLMLVKYIRSKKEKKNDDTSS